MTYYIKGMRKTLKQYLADHNINNTREYEIDEGGELEKMINEAINNSSVAEERFSFLSIIKRRELEVNIDAYNKGISIRYQIVKKDNEVKGKIFYIDAQSSSYIEKSKNFYNTHQSTIDTEALENILDAVNMANQAKEIIKTE